MGGFSQLLWRSLRVWMGARELLPEPACAPDPAAQAELASLLSDSGKSFLHVGCGNARKPAVAPGFSGDEWREIRLDIDPSVSPDIVASMLDMSVLPDAAVDAVYSSHNIEHLYPHEVGVALAEFRRVLKPDGILVLTCPDLQSVCRQIVDDRLDEPAYESAAGPIAPLDILYGLRSALAAGNLFMAHRTGFSLRTLVAAVRAAGFPAVAGKARAGYFDLWLVASRQPLPAAEIEALAVRHLPQ